MAPGTSAIPAPGDVASTIVLHKPVQTRREGHATVPLDRDLPIGRTEYEIVVACWIMRTTTQNFDFITFFSTAMLLHLSRERKNGVD